MPWIINRHLLRAINLKELCKAVINNDNFDFESKIGSIPGI